MPHITEHAPKVSTRSIYPYARESLREKLQQDGQTGRQTHTHTDGLSKTTFLDVLKVVPGDCDNPLQEMSRNRLYRRACRVAYILENVSCGADNELRF